MKEYRKIIYVLYAAIGLVLIIIAIFTGLIVSGVRKNDRQMAWNDETRSEEAEENRNEGEPDSLESENSAGLPPEEDTQADIFDGKAVLVTAAADYMSLRTTPGLGDDVIAELPAGQYLAWDGEQVTVDERDFYKVTVGESGDVGYVAANYCIPVDYRYDSDALTVVEVSDALYTYEQMQRDTLDLCNTYSECLSYEVIGSSADGRQIYAVTLGNPNAPHHIYMQAAIHGREYMTTQLVMKMLEYYAAYYYTGSYHGKTYQDLFNNTAIHVIPMSNPDGVTISQLGVEAMNHGEIGQLVYDCYLRDREFLILEEDTNGDMNWADYYKQVDFDRNEYDITDLISFQDYQKLWKANAYGVDLNNNFDADWVNIDLKQFPSYGSYKGEYAVSEPETQALVSAALSRDYDYFISYHSKGQLIYYDVNGNDEETSNRSYNLAALLQSQIKYEPLNTQRGYNVNLGGFSDWVQLSLHGASVTIESGKHPCPLAIEEFPAIWYRHRESWAMLCENLYVQ